MSRFLVVASVRSVLAFLLALPGRPATPAYACTGSLDDLTLEHPTLVAAAPRMASDDEVMGVPRRQIPEIAPEQGIANDPMFALQWHGLITHRQHSIVPSCG